MKFEIVDSHCHLDFPQFEGQHAALIARARAAGVGRMVTICTRLKHEPQVRALAEAHENVYYAAGTHPMSVASEPMATLEELVALAQYPKCVGLGETGLDYHYENESAEIQKKALRIHIEAAQETGLPLIIHARGADEDVGYILQEGMARKPFGCVLHCFSSGADLAHAALDMGCYLSMSGIATFPKSEALRQIFSRAPLDRILLETDSPYLAPVPYRGKCNEPAYTLHTAEVGAGLFNMALEDFAAQTTANFDRLFPRASLATKGGA